MTANPAMKSQFGDELRYQLDELPEASGGPGAPLPVGPRCFRLRGVGGKPRLPLRWIFALVLPLGAALVACHPSRSAHPPASSPTRPLPSLTATSTAAGADVIAAWRNYWQVYVEIGSQANPSYAQLDQVATGQELTTLESGFLAYHAQGEVIRGSIDLAPKVVAVSDANATLTDCYASHILGYSQSTGQPVGTAPSQRTLVTVTLAREGETWKVAAIRHDGDGCTPTS